MVDAKYKGGVGMVECGQSWSSRCAEAIRRERSEVEKRYGIRIGQTEIYCARCDKPCWPGNHICQDIRFKELQEKQKTIAESLIDKIKALGRSKVSVLLKLPTGTVNHWIARGNVPKKYQAEIRTW